jgi:hypothetical protein
MMTQEGILSWGFRHVARRGMILSIYFLVCCLAGCAYLQDRGRDACDVITASVETGYANASVQIGAGALGIGITEGNGFGSRSGGLGAYDYAEFNLLFVGGKRFIPREEDLLRGKGYEYAYFWNPWCGADDAEIEIYEGGRFNTWQIELAATLGIGARVGINIAELADLILGVFHIDFLDDDIHTIEQAERERYKEQRLSEEPLHSETSGQREE